MISTTRRAATFSITKSVDWDREEASRVLNVRNRCGMADFATFALDKR